MKTRTSFIVVLLTVVLLLSMSTSALACACCAEPGTYSVFTGRMPAFERDLLKDMKFGPAAELYTTAASYDDIKGLKEVIQESETTSSDELDLVDAFTGSTWTLQFMTGGERKGSLVLPRPTLMTSRKVHIPDKASPGPNVVLYKEWIFEGIVRSGSGFFRRDIASPTKYTLIFQGHGNECTNAEDFTNWRLRIKGAKADYAFFGKMKAVG